MIGPITDINSITVAKPAMVPTAQTAGGAGDNAKVTGLTIDRCQPGKTDLAKAAKLCIQTRAVLAAAATQSIAAEYQTSSDGSTWDAAVPMQSATVAATGGGGGSTENAVVELGLNLLPLKRYVRFNITPDLSAANTDTASTSAMVILAGHDTIPQSAA